MHPISWVGVAIALTALIFFARSQFKAPADAGAGEIKGWKLNISGPSYLIVLGIGALLLIFPFTSFFGPPEQSVEAPPVTTPAQESTTTQAPDEPVTTLAPAALPPAPDSFEVFFDEECGNDVIGWTTPVPVAGWYLLVDVYSGADDQYVTTIELDAVNPWVCVWDFFIDDDSYYYVYVYSYDEFNYSEDALVIAYP